MTNKFIRTALIMGLVAAGIDAILHHYLLDHERDERRLGLTAQLAALRASIEKEITGNLLRIEGTANFIALNPDLSPEMFDAYAAEAMRGSTVLRNLAAAPDFVVRYVYPLKGNEAIQGADYRAIPDQAEQALLAKESGKMVVAGPIPLLQGGIGLIGRAPVYVGRAGERRFWGLVSAVIDMDALFARIPPETRHGLTLAIRGVDSKGEKGAVFFGDAALFSGGTDTVQMPVTFPSGEWIIAGRAVRSGLGIPASAWLVHGLVGLITLGGIAFLHRIMRKNHEIDLIRESLNEAQAIGHMGNWEYHPQDGTLWWSDETYRIFGVQKGCFVPTPKAILSLIHPEDRGIAAKVLSFDDLEAETDPADFRILRPDGAVRYVHESKVHRYDSHGVHRRSAGILMDITDRKMAEQAVRNHAANLRAIFNSAPSIMLLVNDNVQVEMINRKGAGIQGKTQEELLGMLGGEVLKCFNATEAGCGRGRVCGECPVRTSVIETFTTGEPTFEKEGRLPLRIGGAEPKLYDLLLSTARLDQEGLKKVLLSITDITARKQIEAEREQLIAQLQKALTEVKKLSGLLPICAQCKKIRDDQGYWNQIEVYVKEHSEADFSHGICPECAQKLYSKYLKDKG